MAWAAWRTAVRRGKEWAGCARRVRAGTHAPAPAAAGTPAAANFFSESEIVSCFWLSCCGIIALNVLLLVILITFGHTFCGEMQGVHAIITLPNRHPGGIRARP